MASWFSFGVASLSLGFIFIRGVFLCATEDLCYHFVGRLGWWWWLFGGVLNDDRPWLGQFIQGNTKQVTDLYQPSERDHSPSLFRLIVEGA